MVMVLSAATLIWGPEMQYIYNVTATAGDSSGKLFERQTSTAAAYGYARMLQDEGFKDIVIYYMHDDGLWYVDTQMTARVTSE